LPPPPFSFFVFTLLFSRRQFARSSSLTPLSLVLSDFPFFLLPTCLLSHHTLRLPESNKICPLLPFSSPAFSPSPGFFFLIAPPPFTEDFYPSVLLFLQQTPLTGEIKLLLPPSPLSKLVIHIILIPMLANPLLHPLCRDRSLVCMLHSLLLILTTLSSPHPRAPLYLASTRSQVPQLCNRLCLSETFPAPYLRPSRPSCVNSPL